jgi:hypothetical protein
MQKVTSLIDVCAPCQEVFNTVVNVEKRMQLSPLWGLSQLLEVTPDFPEPGSSYRVQVLSGAPFGLAQGTLNASQSALAGLAQFLSLKSGQSHSNPAHESAIKLPQQSTTGKQDSRAKLPAEQEYFVAEYQPPNIFSYFLDADCKTVVTWRLQSIPFGTRINYEEVFCDENVGGEDFIPTVRHVIQEWLTNIKRYSELRDGRGRLLIKWFLDRLYLKLRPDQRRIVLVMLAMQAIGLATFVVAVLGWGIISLFL